MTKVESNKDTNDIICEVEGKRKDILLEFGYTTYVLMKRDNFLASEILRVMCFALDRINKEKGEEETDNE